MADSERAAGDFEARLDELVAKGEGGWVRGPCRELSELVHELDLDGERKRHEAEGLRCLTHRYVVRSCTNQFADT